MKRHIIAIGLLVIGGIAAIAQAPTAIKIPPTQAQQFSEQDKWLQARFKEYNEARVVVKLRACLALKLDETQCDSMDVVFQNDTYVLELRPKPAPQQTPRPQ